MEVISRMAFGFSALVDPHWRKELRQLQAEGQSDSPSLKLWRTSCVLR